MRRWVLLALALTLLTVGVYTYSEKALAPKKQVASNPTLTQTVTPSLTPITSAIPFCAASNLESGITLGVGAGNVYGTVTLKNISSTPCQIFGGQFISANYDTDTVKNITVKHVGQTQSQMFLLQPNQTLYSQIHYPNGPQCQSVGLSQTPVTFIYKISPSDEVVFKNQNGNTEQVVQTCNSSTDMTEIQIWKMSTQPITP